MATLDNQERQRLTDDLQGLYNATVDMYRLGEIGDFPTVGDMLIFHLGAIRDLAGRLDIEIVQSKGDDNGE